MKRYKLKLKLTGSGIIMGAETEEVKRATPENFGFWSVADHNHFHPDVKNAKDISPKPEDYFIIPFRFISSTTVGAETRKATKFPAEVLKASMPKLLGTPVYTDHDTETVGNCIGYVESVKWSDGYKLDDGTVIPPGIEGTYAIDSKIAPNIGRNLMVKAINSNSVSVEFFWKPSHVLGEGEDFWDKLGKYDPQGNMYCRVVDEIVGYLETSPVFRGADPFAKSLDATGKVVKPDMANVVYSAENEEKIATDEENAFTIVCSYEKGVLHLSNNGGGYQQPPVNNQKSNTFKMNEKLLKLIALKLNKPDLKAEDITDELIQEYEAAQKAEVDSKPSEAEFSRLQQVETAAKAALGFSEVTEESFKAVKVMSVAEFDTLKAKADKVEGLEAEVQNLTTERDALKPDATVGKKVTEDLRAEAIRLHGVATNGNPNQATLKLINDAKDVAALEGLVASFGGALTKGEFKAHCKKCNSGENITFQKSKSSEHITMKEFTVKSKEEIDMARDKDVAL